MSALAARRAAREAAAATPSAGSSRTSTSKPKKSVVARRKPSPAPVLILPSDSDEPQDETDDSGTESAEDVSGESGPSKKVRLDEAAPATRYFAVETTSTSALNGQSKVKGKGKQKRKRGFSPSMPMMSSDEDDGEGSEGSSVIDEDAEELGGDVAEDADIATPYDSPGPWRAREPDNMVASSRFTPRRSHNVELLSGKALHAAGLEGDDAGLILSLAPDENIYLAGVFTMTPLQGSFSFNNVIISPLPVRPSYVVFSPTSHPIPSISPIASSIAVQSPVLKGMKLPRTFLADGSRVLVLIRQHATGIDGMRAGAIPGFATAWGDEKGWMGVQGVHSIPGSIVTPCYPYHPPDSWEASLAALRQDVSSGGTSPVVLVKGPKRSGKSTMARAALNTLLQTYQRAAWLECDLGQGEFSCGGVIGLWVLDRPVFGPSFSHHCVPLKARYLGTYTPLTCPEEYIESINQLLQVYRYQVQSTSTRLSDQIPLVINTQGWVKGLGEELLHSIEGMAQASHVFAFDAPAAVEGDADRPGWDTSSPTLGPVDLPVAYNGEAAKVFTLEPAPVTPLQQRYTAADLRTLSILAYFHSHLSTDDASRWTYSSPLIDVPPFEVQIGPEGPLRTVYLQGEGAEGVNPADLHLALNGSVVALIEDKSGDMETYQQGRSPPDLDEATFLGLALVRSVIAAAESKDDSTSLTVHLLTPLSADVLSRASGIIKNGATELPTQGLLDWRAGAAPSEGVASAPWDEVPFFDTGAGGVGAEKRKWRRNLMRKGM